jgi:hypothetical protein
VLEQLGHVVVATNAARATPKDGHVSRRTVTGFAEFVSVDELLRACGPIDLFLYVEPLGLIPWGIERAPFPSACIIGDTHRSLRPRLRLARFFDHVFVYQRNHVEAFREHRPNHVRWLPYACDLNVFRDLGLHRDVDVAFVGKLEGCRRSILAELGRRWCVNEQRYYLQHEIAEVYSRARIVINLPVNGDLNFRFFEALSCGAMLLTARATNGQERLFKEGVHYAAFADDRDLFDKVAYYLEHDSERKAMADAGHREVIANHSLEGRLTTVLDTVSGHCDRAAPIRRLSPSDVDREYAWLYASRASVDASLALVHEAKRAGRPWIRLATTAGKTFARRVYQVTR